MENALTYGEGQNENSKLIPISLKCSIICSSLMPLAVPYPALCKHTHSSNQGALQFQNHLDATMSWRWDMTIQVLGVVVFCGLLWFVVVVITFTLTRNRVHGNYAHLFNKTVGICARRPLYFVTYTSKEVYIYGENGTYIALALAENVLKRKLSIAKRSDIMWASRNQ